MFQNLSIAERTLDLSTRNNKFSASRPVRYNHTEIWVDLRTGLNAMEKEMSLSVPKIEPWFLGNISCILINILTELFYGWSG
jgi:hypothetical protein